MDQQFEATLDAELQRRNLPDPCPNLRRRHLAKMVKWRCYWCNQTTRPHAGFQNTATVEHLIPRSQGGPHCVDNVASACYRCNDDRGLTPVDEFKVIASRFAPDARATADAVRVKKRARRRVKHMEYLFYKYDLVIYSGDDMSVA